jgi:hypothetical protein
VGNEEKTVRERYAWSIVRLIFFLIHSYSIFFSIEVDEVVDSRECLVSGRKGAKQGQVWIVFLR